MNILQQPAAIIFTLSLRTQKTDAVGSSETLLPFYKITQLHLPGESNVHCRVHKGQSVVHIHFNIIL
jgi:hypothetical protein